MSEKRLEGPEVELRGKKEYFAPRIVHTEKLEVRAINCAKSDESCAGSGSIQS